MISISYTNVISTNQELFVSKILPKLEGELHIREGKRGSWKKHMFVLRASGLYYSKSGKSLASKDIMRVTEWKDMECFTGSQYKKFFRAPGHHCFSLVVSVFSFFLSYALSLCLLLSFSFFTISSPLHTLCHLFFL